MTTTFGELRRRLQNLPQLLVAVACLALPSVTGSVATAQDRRYSDDYDYRSRDFDARGYGSHLDEVPRSSRSWDRVDRMMRDVDPRDVRNDLRDDLRYDFERRPASSRLDDLMGDLGYDRRPSSYDTRYRGRDDRDYGSHLRDVDYGSRSSRYETSRYESPSRSESRYESVRDYLRPLNERSDRYSPRNESPRYETPRFDSRDTGRYDDRYDDRLDPRSDRRPSGGRWETGRDERLDGTRFPGLDESLGLSGARDRSRYDRLPSDARPVPSRTKPEDTLSDSQKRKMKIVARYGNPTIQRFVQSTSAQQGLRLYQESLQLIDTRHLQPSGYEARVKEALSNLNMAIEEPAFQQANNVRLSAQHVESFRAGLNQVWNSKPVQSGADAVTMLQSMIDVGGRTAGLRPGAIVLEFVNGATDSLDKYSAFMPEEPAQRPSAAILDDHVVGIGVEIKPGEQGVVVKKVLPGGPAAEAGLRAGDVLVAVNGRNLAGQSMDYAVDLITGQPGTGLQVGVVRGNQQPATVNLVRRSIAVASVSEVQMLDRQAGIGYIKLDKFAKSSAEEMEKALWTLHQQGMQSLILDLRGNPGGLLDVCEKMADQFLPGGTIVSTRGRTQSDNTSAQAHREQTWKTPMVVMIDENSASASEILAAAIQDNGRGVIVGRKSYGKGTVQTHFPLQTVSGYLKLTTAKFYSPSGREMAGQGVEPDVYVPESRNGDEEVAIQNDADVIAAVQTARNPRVQELADNALRAR